MIIYVEVESYKAYRFVEVEIDESENLIEKVTMFKTKGIGALDLSTETTASISFIHPITKTLHEHLVLITMSGVCLYQSSIREIKTWSWVVEGTEEKAVNRSAEILQRRDLVLVHYTPKKIDKSKTIGKRSL